LELSWRRVGEWAAAHRPNCWRRVDKASLALPWPSASSIVGAYAKISVGVGQLSSLPLPVPFSSLPRLLLFTAHPFGFPFLTPSSNTAAQKYSILIFKTSMLTAVAVL